MWGAIAGMALGAITGGQGNQSSVTQTRNLAPASAGELRGGELALQNLNDLQALLAQGPGATDVQAGTDAQRQLAALFQQASQTGGVPGAQDISQAQGLAAQLFQGQQFAQQQAFEDQRIQASRAQARMGRGSFDPILQNKLAQEQTRQSGQLAADQGAFATQYAMQLPQQRLQMAQQYAGVQAQLASQAMANRQALFSLGNQLQTQGQNFRAGTASVTQTSSSGGGIGGAISGAIAGAGAGLGAAGNLQSAFSGLGNLFSRTPSTAPTTAEGAWYRG